MTPLRKKMVEAMLVRGFSVRTHCSYLSAVSELARYYGRSPDVIGADELQAFFVYLATERGVSGASCRLYLNAIRFLYLQVLEWPSFDVSIAIPKKAQRIPELLGQEEVARIMAACHNPKHRMMLTTCYGCGLRVGEVVAVKVRHVDGERHLLRVEQGKGAKDRQVIVSQALLEELRAYLGRFLAGYTETHRLSPRQRQVCAHISACRTQALGGLRLRCEHCDYAETHYYACRDRHCPRCQHRDAARWCERQRQSVLPVSYYHVVFTLPHTLNPWMQLHRRVIYGLSFQSVWATLKVFAADRHRRATAAGTVRHPILGRLSVSTV